MRTHPRSSRRRQRGLSLMATVLGLGATAAVTVFAIQQYLGVQDGMELSQAKQEIAAGITAIKTFNTTRQTTLMSVGSANVDALDAYGAGGMFGSAGTGVNAYNEDTALQAGTTGATAYFRYETGDQDACTVLVADLFALDINVHPNNTATPATTPITSATACAAAGQLTVIP